MIGSLSGLPGLVLGLLFLASLGAFSWLLWSLIRDRRDESAAAAPSEVDPHPGGDYPSEPAPAAASLDTGALVTQIQELFDSYRAAADEDLAARLQEFGRSIPKSQAAGDPALTAAVGRLEKTMGELRGRLDELAAVVARQSEAAAVHAAAPSGAATAGTGDTDVREALEYFYIRLADEMGTLKRAVEDAKGGSESRRPEGPV